MNLHVASPRSQVIHLDLKPKMAPIYTPKRKLTWTFKIGRLPKSLSSSKPMDFQRRSLLVSRRVWLQKKPWVFASFIAPFPWNKMVSSIYLWAFLIAKKKASTTELWHEKTNAPINWYGIFWVSTCLWVKCHPFNKKKRASENSWEVCKIYESKRSEILSTNFSDLETTWNYKILLRCAWNVTSSFGSRSSCRGDPKQPTCKLTLGGFHDPGKHSQVTRKKWYKSRCEAVRADPLSKWSTSKRFAKKQNGWRFQTHLKNISRHGNHFP